jgi:hypothetical protein
MSLQPFIRRGTRSNATAQRLIDASKNIAPYVLSETVYDETVRQEIRRCKAVQTAKLAGLTLAEDQRFYLVSSKFMNRYYVVALQEDDKWQCSASDRRVANLMIRRVLSYRTQQVAKAA